MKKSYRQASAIGIQVIIIVFALFPVDRFSRDVDVMIDIQVILIVFALFSVDRFSRDVDVMDLAVARLLRMVLQTFMTLIVVLVVICYSTPIFLVVVVPTLIIYILAQVCREEIQELYNRYFLPQQICFRRLALADIFGW